LAKNDSGRFPAYLESSDSACDHHCEGHGFGRVGEFSRAD
jgi:hypothetical protein